MASVAAFVCGTAIHLLVAGALVAAAYHLFGAPGAACALAAVFLSCLAVPMAMVVLRQQQRPSGTATAAAGNNSGKQLPALFKFNRDVGAAAPQCSICLGEVREGAKVRRLPECGHLFHARCVDEWLRTHPTCPVCRAAAWQV